MVAAVRAWLEVVVEAAAAIVSRMTSLKDGDGGVELMTGGKKRGKWRKGLLRLEDEGRVRYLMT